MNFDLKDALSLLKEGGALVLLVFVLFKGIPALVAALDRNSRILYRIEGKLGIRPTELRDRGNAEEGKEDSRG